ncbi:helix-turn-helix domain-containing protein [Tumebacillus permanentifrigoris]|uniref:DNA-binding XRE family transcriptional regulator n=1 Tax=Tumebacillus permanentifrigoris TaxID=378543 RepID=A0A316D462_9BACL|nr:tetratricopeptide repeat protein [Tumebacillus permanentifrigoris]PWK07023.1 DNA-binding XRE family transcriptional regulator [Tumebacillus permanentifrigoris]
MSPNEGNEKNRGKQALITLGQRVKELRLEKNMTQGELAEGIVTPSMISQIENGVSLPSYRTVAHIATRLGTTVDDLYQGLTFSKMQMSGYKHALSQMAVGHYNPALIVLESFHNEELLHYEIPPDELKLNLAVCYRETQRFDDAVGLLEGLVQDLSSDNGRRENIHLLVNANLNLSETYEDMGRYFEALCSAMSARDVYAKHQSPDPFLQGKLLVHVADLNSRLHRFEEAQACYQQALRVYDQLSDNLEHVGEIYQRLSEVYHHQNNFEMTIEFANKAILALQSAGLVADYREAKRVLVKQQVNAGNWQDSIRVLLGLAAIYTQSDAQREATLYLDVAEIYLSFDETDESLNTCLKALSLLTKRRQESELLGRANFVLAGVHHQKGEYDRAIHALETAVTLFKRHHQLHDLDLATRQLCVLLKHVGKPETAWEYFDETHHFIVEQLRQRGVVL